MTRKSGLVLTDGREVYQSFGGRLLLKTGGLKTALDHLVYRGVDEIVLCMGGKILSGIAIGKNYTEPYIASISVCH